MHPANGSLVGLLADGRASAAAGTAGVSAERQAAIGSWIMMGLVGWARCSDMVDRLGLVVDNPASAVSAALVSLRTGSGRERQG